MKKNIITAIILITVSGLFIFGTNACKKEVSIPQMITSTVVDIEAFTAKSGGDISNDGGDPVTVRGVCWSKHPTPTTDDSKSIDGSGSGIYESVLTSLEPKTKYYVRAYAINNAGTGYGNILYFTTADTFKPQFSVSHTHEDVNWRGGSDGSITLTVSEGTPPFSFEWSNGASDKDLKGLKAGSYTCIVRDKNFEKSYSVTLTEPDKHQIWKIETDFGDIYCWLYNETPLHKKNYLNLIGQGFFDSLIFHRVIKNFVVQGGDPTGTGSGGPGWNIPAEIMGSLKHVYGAIGAARLGDAQNPKKESNGSQFYFCQNASGSPHLNNNYTVFGIVIQGMDAVNAIADVAVDANNRPIAEVVMKKVILEQYTEAELLSNFGFTVP